MRVRNIEMPTTANVRDMIRKNRMAEIEETLNNKIAELNSEGYEVEFGSIGQRTTYALIHKGDEEIVGYTYIQGSLENKNELIGKNKALAQALARKDMSKESKE